MGHRLYSTTSPWATKLHDSRAGDVGRCMLEIVLGTGTMGGHCLESTAMICRRRPQCKCPTSTRTVRGSLGECIFKVVRPRNRAIGSWSSSTLPIINISYLLGPPPPVHHNHLSQCFKNGTDRAQRIRKPTIMAERPQQAGATRRVLSNAVPVVVVLDAPGPGRQPTPAQLAPPRHRGPAGARSSNGAAAR